MDVMDLLAEARPGSLDPPPDPARRASDLAGAIATSRTGTATRPGASPRWRARRPAHPVRLAAIGTSIAALAGTAGAVAALSATGTPAAHPRLPAARAGTAVPTPGEVRNAILTAFNGVSGDVFYTRITEIYPGPQSRWNGVSENWSYPLQPRVGQEVHVRSLVLPRNLGDKSDTEWIYREPAGTQSGSISVATKTEMIDVEYGNRTWSDTTGNWGFPSEMAGLQDLRESIADGKFQHVRKTELNGRIVLELTSRKGQRHGGRVYLVGRPGHLPAGPDAHPTGGDHVPGRLRVLSTRAREHRAANGDHSGRVHPDSHPETALTERGPRAQRSMACRAPGVRSARCRPRPAGRPHS
jgi:hypothetical protein